MLVMGLNGGFFKSHENGSAYLNDVIFHDSAAVLLDAGEVVAAIETERLNRIKHTTKFPVEAIRFCLDSYRVKLRDLDYVAYFSEERWTDAILDALNLKRVSENQNFDKYPDARSFLRGVLLKEFDHDLPPENIVFVSHHHAHALSAFLPSGFDESLILTLDGAGDNESGRIIIGNRSSLNMLASFSIPQSLGMAYSTVTRLLGFEDYDEYKVMGLAPYGNPARFRDFFNALYVLLSNGEYILNSHEVFRVRELIPPRKKWEEITPDHMDVAAALQKALEEIVIHMLSHYKEKTKQRNLCIAGGVGLNCTLNGKILESKMFDRVFVQPAAHDSGCAYGAALSVYFDKREFKATPLRHLYWGRDVGANDEIMAALARWGEYISIRKSRDICHETAQLIADGYVIGWVQGRSEFGPRALGNRSILADPRPEENKDIINAMVKKREAFRPFAPSVLEEYVEDYFEVDVGNGNLSYMTFAVKVRPEKRKLLGAVTHVDGTARIQTVSKETNEKYWSLIAAFRKITGVPVLLNTSFNNNVEPIVDSIDDAVVCYLTTHLNHLVVGDYLISKRATTSTAYLSLVPSLPKHILISQTVRADETGQFATFFECKNNYDPNFRFDLSAQMFNIMSRADGKTGLADLIAGNDNMVYQNNIEELHQELHDLWFRRLIILKPPALPEHWSDH